MGQTWERLKLLGLDLLARRWFLVVVELLELVLADREPHELVPDLLDLLGRDVAGAAEETARDGEPVEDVTGRVADRLLDLAELLAVRSLDRPALLDREPRGRRLRHCGRRCARPAPASAPDACPRAPRALAPRRGFPRRRAARGSGASSRRRRRSRSAARPGSGSPACLRSARG